MKINRRQALLLVLVRQRIKKRKAKRWRKRDFGCREYLRKRKTKGEFHTLVADMKLFDHEYFQKQFRMSPTKLEELLRLHFFLFISNLTQIEPSKLLKISIVLHCST